LAVGIGARGRARARRRARLTALPPSRSEEFKRHKKADAKFVASFFAEWTAYLRQLEAQSAAAGPLGAPLDPALVGSLSEEQRAQLGKLREEAEKPWRDG